MTRFQVALALVSCLVLDNGMRWGEAAQRWQWQDAVAILDEAGVRYHLLTRPRGGSKTTDVAAILIAVMLAQVRDGARLYTLAADRDQGRLILSAMRGFVVRTPILEGALVFSGHRVSVPGRDIVLEVLAADAASSWGLIPDFVVLDEVAQWRETKESRDLFEAIRTSLVKRRARFVVITTAGHPTHFAYEEREHALVDPMWRLHEVPGPAPWSDPHALEEQRRRLPESSYRRLFLNEWLETDDRLASPEELQALVGHANALPPRLGWRYFIGVDIGVVHDRTAVAICHVEEEAREARELPVLRVVVDQIETWTGTLDRPVRLAVVRDWLLEAVRLYRDVRVFMDPWQSTAIAQELQGQKIMAETVPFTPQLKSQMTLGLIAAIREKTLALPDDPGLLQEFSRVRVRATSTGHHWLEHDPGEHDDRVTAVGLALTKALEDAWKPPPRLRALS